MKQEYTPGPWRWELNESSKNLSLCGGTPPYDKTVMDFVRWGMGGAIPRFREHYTGDLELMEKANKYGVPVPGREYHYHWFQNISHPDALLISKAPELLEMVQRLTAALEDVETSLANHALSVIGWHLNGAPEPIVNFFNEIDMESISAAKALIKSATEL